MNRTVLAALAAFTLLTTITGPADARARRGQMAAQTTVECFTDESRPGNRQTCGASQAPVRRAEARRSAPKAKTAKPAEVKDVQTASKPAAAEIPKATGSGVIRSSSGAKATVSPAAAPKFQALVDWIEANGVPVKFMGGIRHRKGEPCSSAHQHGCGTALDINQLGRGVVTKAFPAGTAEYASSLGLVSGSSWCNDDTGHFQVGGWSGCRTAKRTHARVANLYQTVRAFHRRQKGHREARREDRPRMAALRTAARR